MSKNSVIEANSEGYPLTRFFSPHLELKVPPSRYNVSYLSPPFLCLYVSLREAANKARIYRTRIGFILPFVEAKATLGL